MTNRKSSFQLTEAIETGISDVIQKSFETTMHHSSIKIQNNKFAERVHWKEVSEASKPLELGTV